MIYLAQITDYGINGKEDCYVTWNVTIVFCLGCDL